MPSPDYLPLALDLPALYQSDQDSFAQLDSFLGLIDAMIRDSLTDLQDVEKWLSPNGVRMWPPGVNPDQPPDRVRQAHLDCQDELAAWTGFRYPADWRADDAGVSLRRSYLLRSAGLWRRRGTPAGFLDWFKLFFGSQRFGGSTLNRHPPELVEHFRVSDPRSTEVLDDDPWLRATLFVPGDGDFADAARRRQVIAFVDRYAPAHVYVRVCWFDPRHFDLGKPPDAAAADSDDPFGPPDPGTYAEKVRAWQKQVRSVLCHMVSFTDHAHGVRIWECGKAGRPQDRLGIGTLPGGGITNP